MILITTSLSCVFWAFISNIIIIISLAIHLYSTTRQYFKEIRRGGIRDPFLHLLTGKIAHRITEDSTEKIKKLNSV